MQLLSTDPVILTIDDFLTDDECAHIIEISKEQLQRAKTCSYSKEEEEKVNSEDYKGRTNRNCWLGPDKDEIVKNIFHKSAKLLNTDYKFFESLQVIHYKKNQEYNYHYDGWDITNETHYNKYVKDKGNRVFTLLFYLNDVRKGGETGFDSLGKEIKIKPEKGKALLFKSLHEDGTLNLKSKHAGLPVIQGEKWACNLWLRDKIQHKEPPKKTISTILDNLEDIDLDYIDRLSSDDE